MYFQDGDHDVRPPLTATYAEASTGCPLTRRACDVIGSLYALQFLIHNTFVLVLSNVNRKVCCIVDEMGE